MTRSKAKTLILKYYKGLLSIEEGLSLIRNYCMDFGKDEHKTNLETFIILLIQYPHLFTYCLNHAIAEYLVKFSFVEVIAKSDANSGKWSVSNIITIY